MRKYRPKSWSEQARRMANNLYWDYQNGYGTIKDCNLIIQNFYRSDIIKYRAAKRFGKLVRKG